MNKWAYLAGLIDGDGSIFISERGKTSCGGHGYYRLTVCIANCNLDLLKHLEKSYSQSCVGWQSENYHAGRIAWEGPQAKAIVKKILPFIVGKKQQALLALSFPTLGKGAPGVKKKDIATFHQIGQSLFEQMSALNSKWSMGKVRGARKSKNRR